MGFLWDCCGIAKEFLWDFYGISMSFLGGSMGCPWAVGICGISMGFYGILIEIQ